MSRWQCFSLSSPCIIQVKMCLKSSLQYYAKTQIPCQTIFNQIPILPTHLRTEHTYSTYSAKQCWCHYWTHRVGEVQIADLTWHVLCRWSSVDWRTDPRLLAGVNDMTLGEKLVKITIKIPAEIETKKKKRKEITVLKKHEHTQLKRWQIKNVLQRFPPFHKLFFIPVEVTEKDACYCCRILEKQKWLVRNKTEFYI